MSNLIIGAASFSKITDYEIKDLLNVAESHGIMEIDTAPAYGASQEKIGRNLPNSQWKVNTKIFSPGSKVLNRKDVRKSIDESLKLLCIENIHNVFIHSCSADAYGADIHEELVKIRNEGKIGNIGYSGDGADLVAITSAYSFDSFQATLNSLDLANLEFIKSNNKMTCYIKRPLCNKAFAIHPKLELIDFVHRVTNRLPKNEGSYLRRYKLIYGNRLLRRGSIRQNLELLASLDLNARIIVGVSSSKHLSELCEFELDGLKWDECTLQEYIYNWNKLAKKHHWAPLV